MSSISHLNVPASWQVGSIGWLSRWRAGDYAAVLVGLGAGAVVGSTWVMSEDVWHTPGGPITVIGSLTAMLGTYLCLVLILVVARVPWLERDIGQDRLVSFHRRLAPWVVGLVVAHVFFTTLGYAQASGRNFVGEFTSIVLGYPWLVPATLALVLIVGLSLFSIRRARSHVRYETWWVAHLYLYLAVALAFGHQLTAGAMFAENTWARNAWIALYVVVAAMVIGSRLALPLARALRHRLRVESVRRDSNGVVTITMAGRQLEKYPGRGGQFFEWRFLTRDWWWQAHPYSLSAAPDGRHLQITVKALGDQSAALAELRPGTRVVAEGPYGIFHPSRGARGPLVALAAGVGVAPIKALLDDVPASRDVVVIYRVVRLDPDCVAMRDELEGLVARRGWQLHYLTGEIDECRMDGARLSSFAPRLAEADLFVCGPQPFITKVLAAATSVGVPKERIHHELFVF